MKTLKSLPIWWLFILWASSLLLSCVDNSKVPDVDTLTDYSDMSNWYVNAKGEAPKPIDVLFLYPTAYLGDQYSCEVANAQMRERVAVIYDNQASVFEQSCNLYVPFYRQLNAKVILEVPYANRPSLIASIPEQDCVAALEYYMKNYNNGKPFILAGHSQGSCVLLNILAYLKDKPNYLKQMVAAYVVGYSVTQDYLDGNAHLKFATGADDTGVIISWNTEGPVITPPNPLIGERTVAINPISWTTGEELASAEQSLGSRIADETGYHKKPNYADARIDKERGTVICSTVPSSNYYSPLFCEGAMHGGDYELYYYDLQNNIAKRIAAFLSKQ